MLLETKISLIAGLAMPEDKNCLDLLFPVFLEPYITVSSFYEGPLNCAFRPSMFFEFFFVFIRQGADIFMSEVLLTMLKILFAVH